jgi:hypothetical protein
MPMPLSKYRNLKTSRNLAIVRCLE